ncbi:MAG: PIN domain-containing protein [Steroidobacteraceae bacterium]|nr:PIN domain-containing protein [Steroidobacteraceae bacterium]
MRVFLDANVMFSAAKSDGAIRYLLRRLLRAGHVLCADGYVVEEARRNLARKGPDAVATLEGLLASIEVGEFRPARLPEAVAIRIDEKDRPVLAAAVRMGCEALVTGDKTHFGALYGQVLLGVRIESPRSLFEGLVRTADAHG